MLIQQKSWLLNKEIVFFFYYLWYDHQLEFFALFCMLLLLAISAKYLYPSSLKYNWKVKHNRINNSCETLKKMAHCIFFTFAFTLLYSSYMGVFLISLNIGIQINWFHRSYNARYRYHDKHILFLLQNLTSYYLCCTRNYWSKWM